MEDSFETIKIPDLKTADISYGYDSQPLVWPQIDPSNNRNISWMQYFALRINQTVWPTGTGTPTALIFTGKNGDIGKIYTNTLFWKWLGAGNEVTVNITKKYTMDTYYENNALGVWSQVDWVFRIKAGQIAEISTWFNTATMTLNLTNIAWNYIIISGTSISFDNTNQKAIVMNSWTTDLVFRMLFSTTASDRPTFSIFVRVF